MVYFTELIFFRKMNATNTSKLPTETTVFICSFVPFSLLLCICSIIFCTAERRKRPVRATVVNAVFVEADLVDAKTVPPIPTN